MKTLYPNLELIECKLIQIINSEEDPPSIIELDLISFPQNWDLDGQFVKKEYVTVAHDLIRGSYYVFFGTKLGYKVLQHSEEFLNDLKGFKMAPRHLAKIRYEKNYKLQNQGVM